MKLIICLFMFLLLFATPIVFSDLVNSKDETKTLILEFNEPEILCTPRAPIYRFVVSGKITNNTKSPKYAIVLGNLCSFIIKQTEKTCSSERIPPDFCGSCMEQPVEIPCLGKKQTIHFKFWCDISRTQKAYKLLKTINKQVIEKNCNSLIKEDIYDAYL